MILDIIDIKLTIDEYLKDNKDNIDELYASILEEIEIPLLESVMEHYQFNQHKATKVLGISKPTLRKKLRLYFNDKYLSISK